MLYSLSITEISQSIGNIQFDQQLAQRMIFGMYPESVLQNSEKTMIMLSESYVYKDVFALDRIKKSDSIMKLLQALAFQIGNQVSYNELS